MKTIKFIIYFTGIICMMSCEKQHQKEISTLKIENYINNVEKKFVGFETNSLINDELNTYLKKNLKTEINKGVLNDLPFMLNGIEKCGNKYILNLEHSLTSKLYDRGILSKLEIDLYAITDENTAKSLKEGEFYLTEVDFKDYITFMNNEKYCALVLMSPFMGYFDNEIQFGAIAVNMKRIEPMKQ
jgi:hypothetical protein